MFKLLKLLLKIVIAIAVIAAIVFALARLPLGPISNIAKSAEIELLQLLDRNAMTKRVAQEMIDAESEAIAEAMNITTEQAKRLVSSIDFAGWKAIDLPDDAIPTKTVSGNVLGIDGTITLYASTDYLTITANGNALTLEVPDDAKRAVSYLYIL